MKQRYEEKRERIRETKKRIDRWCMNETIHIYIYIRI